ncbi:hypothetical protein EVAR_103591_1 [Eumeta japonica]|uniref:Uncharacterized protein n=1 Tax=Eumeta variegata TaxID=151549 RepID=A0A4C1ZAV2_EUMVA|nr:hypothetical protein EVAR_103591_1 [Eumeta japonica]
MKLHSLLAYNWFDEFKRSHFNLTDDIREGRPSTVTTENNISAVRLMIETAKKVIKQQIPTILDIAPTLHLAISVYFFELRENSFTAIEEVVASYEKPSNAAMC